ncbi:DUF397 domain-containing protein [Nocardia harenae]|uniref:DUF397 domain-containing protein n=1 Tax=Nocardia harenae TaxID=358707 RepID=UPI000A034719
MGECGIVVLPCPFVFRQNPLRRRRGVIGHLDGGRTAVRDSKNPAGPVLDFTPSEWTAFVAGVRAGEFNQA